MSAQPTQSMERTPTPTPAPTLKPSRRSTHLRNTWHLGIKEFHSLARDMAQAPQQIIVSTHLLEHVRHFERVLWLDAGQLRADGPGATVCAAYEADVRQRLQALGN